MLSARIAAAAAFVLIAAHLFLMAISLQDARESVLDTQKMRKLATLVIQNFPDRQNISESAFWKVIGRPGEPMLDSRGNAFQLKPRLKTGREEYFWRSAGADRLLGTRDDLEVQVPFANGPQPDLIPPDATGSPALDAR